jgi:hypothetical protein
MEALLQGARDRGQKIIINIANSYPCNYWDGHTFNHELFVSDVTSRVDTVAPFYPDTVIGLMLLNEPHDPQEECQPGIPSIELYNATRDIRAAFAEAGVGDILLGFCAPPTYIESGLSPSQASDGTITLSFLQWTPIRGEFDEWAEPAQAAAARMSAGGFRHWLIYSVNSEFASDQEVLDMNTWACQQEDAVQVWWYNWGDETGPKVTIPLARFLEVRAVCNANTFP